MNLATLFSSESNMLSQLRHEVDDSQAKLFCLQFVFFISLLFLDCNFLCWILLKFSLVFWKRSLQLGENRLVDLKQTLHSHFTTMDVLNGLFGG